MAEVGQVLLCAAVMAALWGAIGLPVALRTMPPALSWWAAPALGWAIYSPVALIVFSLIGMSGTSVASTSVVVVLLSLFMLRGRTTKRERLSMAAMVAVLGAACLSLGPLAGVLPKYMTEGVVLAAPIFDHSKIALIDEIIRFGVLPANPFFSEAGTADYVGYYYLWHFSAGAIAVMTGASGWEADAALTWFTAFSSLLLMIGLATWISGRASAGILVVVIAATASIRTPLIWIFGPERIDGAIREATGFGGWLFQIFWAPQHVAAATSLVLACYLITRIPNGGFAVPAVLALVAAAAFESSVWVGGVVFALVAAASGIDMFRRLEAQRRYAVFFRTAAAAVLWLALVIPVLGPQIAASVAREIGFPVAISPVAVLGDAFADGMRRLLDVPAYWLVYLPIEFPAFYAAGFAGIVLFLTRWAARDERRPVARAFAILTAVGLVAGWLLVSTVAVNNDLGWRAVLPAIMLLIVFAAAAGAQWLALRKQAWLAVMGGLIALGLVEGGSLIAGTILPESGVPARAFAEAPKMWEAVRRHSGTAERVVNNPDDLATMLPWSVNISWALLADRRSCFAGYELATVFAPITKARREELDRQFRRVFAGKVEPEDVAQLAGRYGCDVVVITSRDGAWSRDPFAGSVAYRLAEERAGEWRIYRKTEAR